MPNPSSPDILIDAETIRKASTEFLCSNSNKGNQNLEQRLESIEQKIDFLLMAVSQLATRPVVKRKRKKSFHAGVTRQDRIRQAVRMFWGKKLVGEKVTKEWAATKCSLGASALSKNGLQKVMKEDIPNAIENAKASQHIRTVDGRAMVLLIAEVDKIMSEFLK